MMQSEQRTVIKGGYVLSMDENLGDRAETDILIEDGIIVKVAPNIDLENCNVIEAENRIVMPGFVDCHRHMWQTQLRALTADWTLFDYAARIRSIYSSFYDPEDAYLGCLAGYAEALNAGVTTIADHCHIINSPEHADETIRAFKESGMRGLYCYGLFKNPTPEDQVSFKVFLNPDWLLNDLRRVRQQHFSSEDSRVQLGVALAESEFFPLDIVAKGIALSREIGAKKISSHVGLGAMSKFTRFVDRLEKAGLMGSDFLFVHGWNLTDHELKIIARHKSSVVCTPETELQMGMGMPVTARVIASGGLPALGIDIVSNQSADMFTQMRLNLQIQRALENAQLERKHLVPHRLNLKARDLLEIATIGGARALGLDHLTGSITPGKKADIILIRSDTINMVPVNDPANSVVMSANVGDIDTVLVEGKQMKSRGSLMGIDWDELSKKLTASRDKILSQAEIKGFEQGENAMKTVFPLYSKTALAGRIGAYILRIPIPILHRFMYNSMLKD